MYHEAVFSEGDDGMRLLELLNPMAYSFIQAMCRSSARLEAVEDEKLVQENTDWQRCISVGLESEKVTNIALNGYRDTIQKRFEVISVRIDETLKEGESGILFVRDDHRIQFTPDIQVFYVAPPALDALKRWISDLVRPRAREAHIDTEA